MHKKEKEKRSLATAMYKKNTSTTNNNRNKVVQYKHSIPRWSIIQWMALLGRLATKDRLHKWGGLTSDQCVLCFAAEETHDHLFFQCPFSTQLWRSIQRGHGAFYSATTLAQLVDRVRQSRYGSNTFFLHVVFKLSLAASV